MPSQKKCNKERKLVSFDWAIKRLLRSKANFAILEGFLSELLKDDIRILKLLESESNKAHAVDKYNRTDLLVENSQNEMIIIEVQVEPELDYLHRMLYGSSKIINEYLDEGQPYSKVKKVISVNLVYFHLGQGEDYVYHGSTDFKGIHHGDTLKLSDSQMSEFSAEHIAQIFPEYYILRINEFNDVAKDGLDEWIHFLKHETVSEHPKAKGLALAKDKLDVMKLSENEQQDYRRHQENVRYRLSLIEGSFRRAERESRLRKEEYAKRKIDQARLKEKELELQEEQIKRKEDQAKLQEKDAKLLEKEAKLQDAESKRKKLQDLLRQHRINPNDD